MTPNSAIVLPEAPPSGPPIDDIDPIVDGPTDTISIEENDGPPIEVVPPVPVEPIDDGGSGDRPRAFGGRPFDDWMSTVGSALGSFGLVWVLYEQVLTFSGVVGFMVCWYVAFLGIYAAVSAMSHPRPVVVDRLASAVVHAAAILCGSVLIFTVGYPFYKGWSALRHLNFFIHDMSGVRPTAALNHGGIYHAILGSFIEVGIAAVIALPLGVGTAIFMTEVGGGLARAVRTVVEAMTALPDILAGLFIYATLILKLGVERSGFAAAMALTVMMLPIIARSADVTLRIVPGGLREAGLALGASRWQTIWRVVLPTVKSGLATALILGIARAVGETAPVLITSGATTFTNWNPTKDPMNSLPLYIYTAVRSGEPAFITRGWAAAAVLLTIVLLLFMVVRLLARQKPGQR